jgi:quercetin dioxygenase-like cupin family protein
VTTVVQPKDRPLEGWDDPARGTLMWQTLISGDITPTKGMVAGLAIVGLGETLAPHSHPQDEIYVGLEGTGAIMVGGVVHPLPPGALIFIPGGTEHAVPPATAPFRYLYVFPTDRFSDVDYTFAG